MKMTETNTVSTDEILLPAEFTPEEKGDAPPRTAEEILKEIGMIFKNAFLNTFKDKKRLIIAVALAAVWFVISLLPALGINSIPVQILSFLTFAKGGLTGGIPGFVGGIIGKGLIAYLIVAIATGKFAPDKIKQSIASLIGSYTKKFSLDNLSPLLVGVGAALIIYNFMAGTATIQNCLVGIAAFLLAAKSFASRGGILRQIVTSVFLKNKKIDTSLFTKFMAGWASGFALGVVISLISFGYLCYIAGAVVLVAGIVLFAVMSQQKPSEAEA